MMGFAASSVAVALAAWFGYCAGRAGAWGMGHKYWNRAYAVGWDTAVRQQRAGLTLRTHAERVPVGTSQLPPASVNIPMPTVQPPRRMLVDQFGHRNTCDCEICRDWRDG